MKLLFAAAFAGAALSAGAAAAQPLPDFPQNARPGECYARVPTTGPIGAPAPLAGGGQRVWTVEKGAGPAAVWRFDQRPGDPVPGPSAGLGWAVVDCATGRPIAPVQHAGPTLPPAPFAGPPVSPPPPGDVFAEAPPPPPPVMGGPEGGPGRHMMVRPRPQMHAQPHLQPVPPFAPVPGPQVQPPMAEFGPRHPMPPHGPQYAAPSMPGPYGPQYEAPSMPGPHGPRYAAPSMPHPMPPFPHDGPQHGPHHGPQHGPAFAGAPAGPVFAPPPFAFPPAPETYAQAPAAPRWFGDRFLTWPGKR